MRCLKYGQIKHVQNQLYNIGYSEMIPSQYCYSKCMQNCY